MGVKSLLQGLQLLMVEPGQAPNCFAALSTVPGPNPIRRDYPGLPGRVLARSRCNHPRERANTYQALKSVR